MGNGDIALVRRPALQPMREGVNWRQWQILFLSQDQHGPQILEGAPWTEQV